MQIARYPSALKEEKTSLLYVKKNSTFVWIILRYICSFFSVFNILFATVFSNVLQILY